MRPVCVCTGNPSGAFVVAQSAQGESSSEPTKVASAAKASANLAEAPIMPPPPPTEGPLVAGAKASLVRAMQSGQSGTAHAVSQVPRKAMDASNSLLLTHSDSLLLTSGPQDVSSLISARERELDHLAMPERLRHCFHWW